MEAREIKIDDLSIWDELVDRSAQGSIFQKKDWLLLCKEDFDMHIKIYGCFNGDELVGGCSGYIKNRGPLKSAFLSAKPISRYGSLVLSEPPGPSVRSRETWGRDIIRTVINAMEKDHYQQITIVNSPAFKDIRPFTWQGWTNHVYYTYILDLMNLSKDSIERNAQKCIRKGMKNGYVIKKVNDPAAHNRLFEEMYKSKGEKPNASLKLFESVLGSNGRKAVGEMWVAETPEGEMACSLIVCYDNKTAYTWTEATHPEHRNQGANYLLLYEVMQDLARRGHKRMDIMRANVPEFASFASQLNPALVPYYMVERLSLPQRAVNWGIKAVGL